MYPWGPDISRPRFWLTQSSFSFKLFKTIHLHYYLLFKKYWELEGSMWVGPLEGLPESSYFNQGYNDPRFELKKLFSKLMYN
jgi:hypothetical protein